MFFCSTIACLYLWKFELLSKWWLKGLWRESIVIDLALCVRHWRLVDTVLERSSGRFFFFFAKTAAVILTAVPSATLQHLQPRGNPISPALVSWGLKRPWHAFAAFRDPCLLWENKPELTWWRMGDCVEQKWAISAPGALDWPSTWPQTHE